MQSQTHGQVQEVDAIEAASTMLLSSLDAEMTIEGEEDAKQVSPILAIGLVLGGLGLLLGGGYMLRGQIQAGTGFGVLPLGGLGHVYLAGLYLFAGFSLSQRVIEFITNSMS